MDRDKIIEFLETLEDSCFPIQIDWNKKDLYIKGFEYAYNKVIKKDNNLESQVKNEDTN